MVVASVRCSGGQPGLQILQTLQSVAVRFRLRSVFISIGFFSNLIQGDLIFYWVLKLFTYATVLDFTIQPLICIMRPKTTSERGKRFKHFTLTVNRNSTGLADKYFSLVFIPSPRQKNEIKHKPLKLQKMKFRLWIIIIEWNRKSNRKFLSSTSPSQEKSTEPLAMPNSDLIDMEDQESKKKYYNQKILSITMAMEEPVFLSPQQLLTKLCNSPLLSFRPAPGVAIIGSGVVGLLNAYLLKARYPETKVSIYAEQIPRFGNKDNSELITSQIAPGHWLPYSYGLEDQKKHKRWSNFAFQWYSNLAKKQQFSDVVKEVEVYSISDTGVYEEESKLTDNIKPTSKVVEVKLNGRLRLQAYVIKTLKIDMQPFLNIVMQELKSLQVSFVTKKINRENLAKLTQSIIFNCSGLGSRQLFGDTNMKGVKGHLIEYKNILPQKYNYFLKVNLGDKYMAYYMHASRILIGRVSQQVETRTVDERTVKEIQEIHKKILEKFGLKQTQPKL